MDQLVQLAGEAVENYIREKKTISPADDLPEEILNKKAGVFVTIEKDGELRGCIGTYLPTRINIAEEIIYNAIAAATEDYRFDSIRQEELPRLFYTVYILQEPETVKDMKELDPKKFGLIVKTTPFAYPNQEIVFDSRVPFKSGLLLPDLEGIDSAEKQFLIACQKGDIDPKKEKTFIYKFTVEKHR